mgnify:CR=1 FL=1
MLFLPRRYKKDRDELRRSVSQQIRLKILEEPPSGSSHERVIAIFREFFSSSLFTKGDSFLKMRSMGRLALPTLYSVVVDNSEAKDVCRKIFREKLENSGKQNQDENMKFVESKVPSIRAGACILISKIVSKLEAEEKSKAADVLYYALASKEFDEDIKFSALYGISSVGESANLLIPLANQIMLDKCNPAKLRSQAMSIMAGMQGLGKRSADAFLTIASDESEDIVIRRNAVIAFGDISEYVDEDKIKSAFSIFVSELEKAKSEPLCDSIVDSLANFGERCVDSMLSVVDDPGRKASVRLKMLQGIYGVGRTKYMLRDYIVGSLVKLKEKYRSASLKPDVSSEVNPDLKIYNEMEYIIRNLATY